MRGRASYGVNQRAVDLTLRPASSLSPAIDATTLSGRTQVAPSSIGAACNIVFIGQSTNNNGLDAGAAAFTLVNTNNVYNGSIGHRGSVFRAVEPLLSSDLTGMHHGMNVGDSLVTAGSIANVVLWNIAFGGSWAATWCPGGGLVGTVTSKAGELAYRIGLVARCIYNAGLDSNRTIIDWQIGEWDTDDATTQTNYANALSGVILEFKRVGLLRTGNVMFVHPCTRIAGLAGSKTAVHAAQTAAPDAVLVRAGADIDTITTNRPDGTHFNRAGAAAQAALKLPFYQNFLANG